MSSTILQVKAAPGRKVRGDGKAFIPENDFVAVTATPRIMRAIHVHQDLILFAEDKAPSKKASAPAAPAPAPTPVPAHVAKESA